MTGAQKIYTYGVLTGTVFCIAVYSTFGSIKTGVEAFKLLGKK